MGLTAEPVYRVGGGASISSCLAVTKAFFPRIILESRREREILVDSTLSSRTIKEHKRSVSEPESIKLTLPSSSRETDESDIDGRILWAKSISALGVLHSLHLLSVFDGPQQ